MHNIAFLIKIPNSFPLFSPFAPSQAFLYDSFIYFQIKCCLESLHFLNIQNPSLMKATKHDDSSNPYLVSPGEGHEGILNRHNT